MAWLVLCRQGWKLYPLAVPVCSYLPLYSCLAQSQKPWKQNLTLPNMAPPIRCFHPIDQQGNITDYEHERKSFNLIAPPKFNFVRDVIEVWATAEKCGKKDSKIPALWWIDDKGNQRTYTFQAIASHSRRVANILTGPCGLKRGDRLIVILPRIPEWWMINLACIQAGLVISPGTVLLRSKDIKYRLQHSSAKCIIVDSNTVEFVDQVCGDCPDLTCKIYMGSKADTRTGWLNFQEMYDKATDSFQTVDTASSESMMLFFTSGTTGTPKMTEHTHASYGLGHLITAKYFLMAGPGDIVWNVSDTGWAKSAYSSFFAPWLRGACVFTQHTVKFDPKDTLKVLSKYPISHLCTPPTAKRLMVKERLSDMKFPHLRHTVCAGEPVNPELMDEWKEGTGLEIFEGYGQTETTLLCARNPYLPYKPGSMGKSVPGFDIQIVDEDGNLVAEGVEGIVGVRCHPHRPVGLFSYYLGDSERNESVFRGDFYLTGDRAYMDSDSYIWFVGRADDVINSAGYRIGPFEVESALLEHPAVLESAVVSSPDEMRGEIVKAFVILTPEYYNADLDKLTSELQSHVKDVTAPYKYPRKIEFVKELPKTISGKIRRVELREKEWK